MTNDLHASKRSGHAPLLLGAAVLLYLLTAGWNLGGQTIANPDEPRFACAARDMLRTGDWIVPKFNGQERLKKPILFYWIIAATGRIGQAMGVALETGMRAGPVLMGLLTVIATFLIASRLLNSARAAFVAAVVLMTCNEFHKVSREIVIDGTLTAFLTWSWYFVLEALSVRDKKAHFLFLLGFYISIGLACMTKGPLPVAGFVVFPLLVYLFLAGRLNELKRSGIWWGAPISLLIGFWWFYVLKNTGHSEGVSQFFLVENIKRIVGEKDHIHPWPWAYYFMVMWEGFAPWILLLPFLVWKTWKASRPRIRELPDALKYVLSALGAAFIIIGLSQSKRLLYLLPLFPPFAVWVAWFWRETIEPFPFRVKAGWAALGLAVIAALSYEIFWTPMREKAEDRVKFFAAIKDRLKDRPLATHGESANEAVWYLDRKDRIANLTNPKLETDFFNKPGTVLLLKQSASSKKSKSKDAKRDDLEEKLRDALTVEMEWERADGTFLLATPDPTTKPDPEIFKPRRANATQDSDPGED